MSDGCSSRSPVGFWTDSGSMGSFDAAKDPRNWRAERGEELCDVLIYSAIAEVAALARLDTLAAEHPELPTQSAQERLAATPEVQHGAHDGDDDHDAQEDR